MKKTNEIITDLKKDGISIIDSFASNKQLELLNQEFDEFLSKEHKGAKHTEYSKGRCARVNTNEYNKDDFPSTQSFFSNKEFKIIAKKYLGNKVNLNSEIFVVEDIVGSKHIANDLHYDVENTLKFFLYLTDTTKENGAFSCVPGSHLNTKKYREVYKDKISYENRHLTRELDSKKAKEKISIEGKAGTLIIFDTDVWHQAGSVSNGTRRVMRGHTRIQSQSHQNISLLKRIWTKIIKI
jgi:ectoine hydroxylase-related dioxygenase (phytanoyl-CoA dioxygenase family)